MGTPQVSGGGGVSVIDLANLLGGQKSTQTGTANTSLISALAPQVLQPNDPAALIASLFSQAQGQMPALQAARANAVGARSGRNSAVVGASDKLLQDTVLKAQAQIAQQEQTRQQIAASLANGLAQSTRGSNTQQGTNLTRVAGTIGVLQGASKLADSRLGRKAGDFLSNGFDQLQTSLLGSPEVSAAPELSGAMQYSADVPQVLGGIDAGTFSTGFDFGAPAVDTGSAVGDSSWADEFANIIGLANGGLIGRDDVAQRKKMSSYSPKGYADGGVVRASAAGGRVSSAPTYVKEFTQRSVAQNTSPLIRALGFSGDTAPTGEADPGGSVADAAATGASGQANIGQAANVGINAAIGNVPGAIGAAVGNPAVSAAISGIIGLATQNPIPVINAIAQALAASDAASGATIGSVSNSSVPGPSGPVSAINSVAPVNATPNPNAVTISSLIAAADNANTAGLAGTVGDSSGSTVGDSSGAAVGTGDGSDAGGGPSGMANGGAVRGKGNGISDSNVIRVSTGEYVVPADVVQKMGTAFFDNLRAQFHTPAEVQASEETDGGHSKADPADLGELAPRFHLPGFMSALDTDDGNGDDVG